MCACVCARHACACVPVRVCLCVCACTRVSSSQAIPVILGGQDALICSETGSGKTLAYLAPLLQGLAQTDPTTAAAAAAGAHCAHNNNGKGVEDGGLCRLLSASCMLGVPTCYHGCFMTPCTPCSPPCTPCVRVRPSHHDLVFPSPSPPPVLCSHRGWGRVGGCL
jgi:hypothetical protein